MNREVEGGAFQRVTDEGPDIAPCRKSAKTGIDQLVGVCSGTTPNDAEQIRPRRAMRPDRITPISNVPLPRPLQPTLQRRPWAAELQDHAIGILQLNASSP